MSHADCDPWACLRGLQPLSLCDWPSKVSTVLFLGGCNLRCPTCHNAQLAWRPETLPRVSKNRVLSYLDAKSAWLDGIVLSGGEPSCVPGLCDLCADLARTGLPLKLDSNGFRPHILEDLLESGLVQTVAVDVKGPWEKYPGLTGGRCTAREAQSALEAVFDLAVRYQAAFIFRCTRVPQLNEEDIQTVRASLPPGYALVLQDFVPHSPADRQTSSLS
jgi:pyruvate formate lyase activating enzyme